MSKRLGFEIKNISNRNISINEEHFKKLKEFLNLDIELEEIKFDFTKNLGKYSYTEPIKDFKECNELAEFIGIILGDGSIYNNQIDIALDKRDIFYIEYVKKLANLIFQVEFRIKHDRLKNCSHLYFYNKILIPKLLDYGLMRGDKIRNQIMILDWIKNNIEYSKACIRGLVNTDGCIYYCKREKKFFIGFTNRNLPLLNDFKSVTKKLGYNFTKSGIWNTRLYRKDEVARFINEIKPFKSVGVVV